MIRVLIKINIKAIFSGASGKAGRKKKISGGKIFLIVFLALYLAAAAFVMVGTMFYQLCAPFFDLGIGWFYFALAGLLVFILCFIGSVFMIQSLMFHAKDNELLLSMPVKPRAILAGRLAALLIVEYVFEAVVLIPAFVVLLITGYISQLPAIGIVFFFAAGVLLPLLSLAVGCLFGWIIALITSRMRNKSIVTLLLSIAFLAAYFYLYFNMMSYLNSMVGSGVQIADAVRRAVFPAYHLGAAVADGSFVSFIIFALCAIAPFGVMCAILSRSFIRLVTAARGAKRVEYHEKALHASGALMALLKREFSYYRSAPMYIMNSSLGALGSLAIAAVLIVRPGLLTGPVAQISATFPVLDSGLIGAIVLSALASLNYISAPSISLEGNRLWIVKSLPVEARVILTSKVLLHFSVCAPLSLLAGVACLAVMPAVGVLGVVLTLIMPASVTLAIAMFGVTLNLAFPRFDWINPVQPVKQGLSSMVTMFGGMFSIVVFAVAYYLLSSVLSLELYLCICTVVFLAVAAGLYAYLAGAGSRRFEGL